MRDADALTGTVKLQWFLGDASMVYLGYDRSFRPPGTFITPDPLQAENLIFDEETSNAFEIGFKTDLADGRVRLNGSVFQQRYDGYQARAVQPFITLYDANGDVFQRKIMSGDPTFNADVTVTGVEIEFQSVLTENWTLYGGIAYTDSTFDDGELGPSSDPLTAEEEAQLKNWATSDIGGERVSTLPEWSANLTSEYAVTFSSLQWYLRGLYNWSSEREDRLIPDEEVPSYGILSLWTGIRSEDGRWDANIWAKNITDETEKTQPYPLLGIDVGPVQAESNWRRSTLIPPRTIGAILRYNFDI